MQYSIGLRASQLRWNVNCCGCLRYSVHGSKHRLRPIKRGQSPRLPNRKNLENPAAKYWKQTLDPLWLVHSINSILSFQHWSLFYSGQSGDPIFPAASQFFIPPAPAKYGILWSTGTGLSHSVWNRPSDHRAQESEELDGTKWLCYHDKEYRMDQEISDQGHCFFRKQGWYRRIWGICVYFRS